MSDLNLTLLKSLHIKTKPSKKPYIKRTHRPALDVALDRRDSSYTVKGDNLISMLNSLG